MAYIYLKVLNFEFGLFLFGHYKLDLSLVLVRFRFMFIVGFQFGGNSFVNLQGIWGGMVAGICLQTLILIGIIYFTNWNKEVLSLYPLFCDVSPLCLVNHFISSEYCRLSKPRVGFRDGEGRSWTDQLLWDAE